MNYKLLEFADDGLIDGFTTDVAAYEFVYNAFKGNLTGGDPVEPGLLSEFLEGFPTSSTPIRHPGSRSEGTSSTESGCSASRSAKSCTSSPGGSAPTS